MMTRACYSCIYRGEVPGSAHSSCNHPATASAKADPLMGFVGLLGKRSGLTTVPSDAARKLNIRGVRLGIERGWFLWPVNFDPTWLENCDGFTPKPETSELEASR
jgi:hypothetical protein